MVLTSGNFTEEKLGVTDEFERRHVGVERRGDDYRLSDCFNLKSFAEKTFKKVSKGMMNGLGGCPEDCENERVSSENLPFDTKNYGGFGGEQYFKTGKGERTNTVIVFVHGNSHDACSWKNHAEYLIEEENYHGDAIWSITIGEMFPNHEDYRKELEDFVTKITDYTGADSINIVSHSLGVTGARYWMQKNSRAVIVDNFVGIAGGNSGIATCKFDDDVFLTPTGREIDYWFDPNKIENQKNHPINWLNRKCKKTESVDYYTVRGRKDKIYAFNPRSPRLDFAEENYIVNYGHEGARESEETIKKIYNDWI